MKFLFASIIFSPQSHHFLFLNQKLFEYKLFLENLGFKGEEYKSALKTKERKCPVLINGVR